MHKPYALARGWPRLKEGALSGGGHGHLRDLARKDAEKWSLVRVPSCSNWPTSLEGHAKCRSGQAWAQRMPWDSYPAALAWPRAPASEPSSAGQEACRGLTRRDMEITSSHPGPFPRPEPPPLATSIPPGAQRRKVALPAPPRGELVRPPLHLCLWSLLTLHPYHPKHPSCRLPASPRDCLPTNSGGLQGRDPDPQALHLGDPWMQTQPRLPNPRPAFCNRPFPLFPADICPALNTC